MISSATRSSNELQWFGPFSINRNIIDFHPTNVKCIYMIDWNIQIWILEHDELWLRAMIMNGTTHSCPKGQLCWDLMLSLFLASISCWTNRQVAEDFRSEVGITDPLWGESPSQWPVMGKIFLSLAWTSCWSSNRVVRSFKCHDAEATLQYFYINVCLNSELCGIPCLVFVYSHREKLSCRCLYTSWWSSNRVVRSFKCHDAKATLQYFYINVCLNSVLCGLPCVVFVYSHMSSCYCRCPPR